MSTINEIYRQGMKILSEARLESPAFDSLFLLNEVFGIENRTQLAIHGNEPADEDKSTAYLKLIQRRLTTPLQYIVKKWEFDGMELNVGEGVLVPREDTLTLVEAAQHALNGIKQPKILDLCAGSGAVGISLARRIPDSSVTCVEKSDDAFNYLSQNISEFGDGRVAAVRGDVMQSPELHEKYSCIVSNPPYIPSTDIETLQWEVKCEPFMALDGGADGLNFYRAICDMWLELLEPHGIIAFEVGYDIVDGVTEIMRRHHVSQIARFKDVSGIDRCIMGTLGG